MTLNPCPTAHAKTLLAYLTSNILALPLKDPSFSPALLSSTTIKPKDDASQIDQGVEIERLVHHAVKIKCMAMGAFARALIPNPSFPLRPSLFTYEPGGGQKDSSDVTVCVSKIVEVLGDCVDLDSSWELLHFCPDQESREESLSEDDKAFVRLSAAKASCSIPMLSLLFLSWLNPLLHLRPS